MQQALLVIIKTDGTTEQKFAAKDKASLQELQAAVGGYIEGIKVRYNGEVRRAYANSEGILEGLPINLIASRISREFGYDGIVGDVVIEIRPSRAKKGS